ncbi:MAG: phosphoribosylformylglycinamidine synthase subunit PurQ [Sphingomonadales bacterium]|nr:phosphoribosylformylglycinamidine synthase subunit PurQ [Sphingomonadales bacterium]
MKSAVIVFPASNCDRDMAVALEKITGTKPEMVWHGDATFPDVDFIALPGGFSYGDYLRSGAMASRSPVMREVIKRANDGVPVFGVCNGFQILTEAGLLPGALMRNADLKFICKDVHLKIENAETRFTNAYLEGQTIRVPVAHHDGNYFADAETLKAIEGDGQVVFRYADADGNVTAEANINGSQNNIAGIVNAKGNVLGMMPHPERLIDDQLGGTDGVGVFQSLVNALAVL